MTEAFAWVTAVFLAGSALGSAVAGGVLPHAGLGFTFALGGLGCSISFLILLLVGME